MEPKVSFNLIDLVPLPFQNMGRPCGGVGNWRDGMEARGLLIIDTRTIVFVPLFPPCFIISKTFITLLIDLASYLATFTNCCWSHIVSYQHLNWIRVEFGAEKYRQNFWFQKNRSSLNEKCLIRNLQTRSINERWNILKSCFNLHQKTWFENRPFSIIIKEIILKRWPFSLCRLPATCNFVARGNM